MFHSLLTYKYIKNTLKYKIKTITTNVMSKPNISHNTITINNNTNQTPQYTYTHIYWGTQSKYPEYYFMTNISKQK